MRGSFVIAGLALGFAVPAEAAQYIRYTFYGDMSGIQINNFQIPTQRNVRGLGTFVALINLSPCGPPQNTLSCTTVTDGGATWQAEAPPARYRVIASGNEMTFTAQSLVGGSSPALTATLTFEEPLGSGFSDGPFSLVSGPASYVSGGSGGGYFLSGNIHSIFAELLELPGEGLQSPRGGIGFGFTEYAVPEPTAWAMLISGFGLVGGAMRRRKTNPLALPA